MAKDFLSINPQAAGALARKGAAIRVREITERTAVQARILAPGTMKQKIRPIVTGGSNPLGIVMVEHPAASFVLQGTNPHKIYPRKPNGVLRFTAGGQVVFARYVNHPGTKPNNFLLKALEASKML